MPPKRKKAVPKPDVPELQHLLSPPASQDAPRRSSRRRRLNDVEEMAETGLSPLPNSDANSNGKDTRWQALQSRQNVRLVVKELSDMEQRLHSDVKRQQRAVEASDLVDPGLSQSEPPAFKSKPNCRGRKEVVNQPLSDGRTLKPASPEEIEAAPVDNDEAAQAAKDVNADGDELEMEAQEGPTGNGAARPPAVNSDYLPLPWTGRLGYACLNTYLRAANPAVFSSRTCRIASIIQHRHPLQDPSLPEHPTKNRPDESKPKDIRLGQKYVEALGLANAKDIVKMLRWNEKYGIKFMRLSSEMFPFASHDEYGYSLAPFASQALAEAGRVAAELGHRLTTHPGQFTQLGSPRKEVVTAAVRDLNYHDELLSLLKLPEQQNRDAIMILHMGGTFGDKAATLDRFRDNYAKLSPSVKARLVLENDDVGWSVHDLLPICEELNIPMVLDFHHHNIVHNSSQLREGTKDIMDLFPRIKATWTRKGITQKMHYSESCAGAVTPRDRRKHSPRVKTLPPCDPNMDLMIEAKDKEQAVLELMRTFRLPGHELASDLVPHEREDENRPQTGGANGKKKGTPKKTKKGSPKKKRKNLDDDEYMADGVEETVKKEEEEGEQGGRAEGEPKEVSPEDFGMGGPLGRVYWPEGMEIWLKPKKKEVKKSSKSTKILDGDD